MGKPELRSPKTQRQGEQEQTFTLSRFAGMLKGSVPPTEIPPTHAYLNKNVVDYGEWYEGRPGTRLFSDTAIPSGTLYASLDHTKSEKILRMYDSKLYYCDKSMGSWDEVLNLSSVTPSGRSSLIEFDEEGYLIGGPIFRIVLDGDYPYMYQINVPLPTVMITDVPATTGVLFGYRYLYALARIIGDGNRNRTSDGAVIVMESGTAKDPNIEKTYGEVWFDTSIGEDATEDHVIEYLTCPFANQEITHFPVYRTRNFGNDSGGDGTDRAYFVWVEDVPVCKAVSGVVAGNTVTPAAGENDFEEMDIGCTLRNAAGGSGVIESVSSGVATLQAGHSFVVDSSMAIGEGRVMTVEQSGIVVTRTGGDDFVEADEGRTLFLADGTQIHIETYVDAGTVYAAISQTKTGQAATIQKTTGTYAFRRKFNDTLKDDGEEVGEVGLKERQLSASDLYIPLYGYNPLPSADLGKVAAGWFITGIMGETKHYYSAIGAKQFAMGQYHPAHQYESLPGPLTEILVTSSVAIFVMETRTYNNVLSSSLDMGNADVGESIPKLFPSSALDDSIGVVNPARESIFPVGSNYWLALTNEPAIRTLDGQAWSRENYAIDQITGDASIMDYLTKIDYNYPVISWYSEQGGYKLRFEIWETT